MRKYLLALSILTILLHSCKEGDVITTPELTSTQASQDNLTAESIFNDIGRIIEEGLINNGQNKGCPSYNLMNSNNSDIDTLIIDFGSGECPPNYGKIRTGKIIVTYTGKYNDSASVTTSTFDNYYVNNNLVEGERIITNNGRNINGNLWFTIDINNASITTPINGTINWQSNRNREWIEGEETQFYILDDKYRVTGTSNGNGMNGNNFIIEISDALDVDLSCLPSCIIKSGTAIVSPEGYPERLIDYGDSLCDCNIDIIINGSTYPILTIN